MASKGSLKIQNIVATTSLGKDVPLTKLAKTIPNTIGLLKLSQFLISNASLPSKLI